MSEQKTTPFTSLPEGDVGAIDGGSSVNPSPDEVNQNIPLTEESPEGSTLFSASRTEPPAPPSVKKRVRMLIACIAAVAVLAGALAAVQLSGVLQNGDGETSDSAGTSSTSDTPALDPLVDKSKDGEDAVISIALKTAEHAYTLAKTDAGTLAVEEYADLPRDAEAVSSLQKALLTLTPLQEVAARATDEQLAACGLSAPAVTLSVTYADGDTLALEFGSAALGSADGYYARVQGQSAIYLLASSLFEQVNQAPTAFVGRSLMPAPTPREDDTTGSVALQEITLSGADRTTPVAMRFVNGQDDPSLRLAGNYVLTSPYLRAANAMTVNEWANTLAGLSATGIAAVHPTDKQLEEYGLKNPHSVGTLTFAIRRTSDTQENTSNTQENTTGEPEVYGALSYTLSLGKKADSTNYYALLDGVDIVYLVSADTVPWAELQYGDLVATTLFLQYITDISDITFTQNGKTDTLHLTHGKTEDEDGNETDTLAATWNGAERNTDSTRALYRLLMMIKRIGGTGAGEGEQGEALTLPSGDAALTVTLKALDGGADTLHLYPYSANRYLCEAGDGDVYLVKASDVETLQQQLQVYADGGTVQG